jgi:hypothetical protein
MPAIRVFLVLINFAVLVTEADDVLYGDNRKRAWLVSYPLAMLCAVNVCAQIIHS